jgi:hypothetical protein
MGREYPMNKSLCLKQWEVRAMLEGRLTQVRRPVKFGEPFEDHSNWNLHAELPDGSHMWSSKMPVEDYPEGIRKGGGMVAPYAVGDVVSIKETYCDLGDGSIPGRILYKATFDDITTEMMKQSGHGTPIWRSPATMPLWASRLSRVVTGVRCERVQEINEQDAIKCGIAPEITICSLEDVSVKEPFGYRYSYSVQIDKDYPLYPFDSNPWQFVYEVGEVK